MPLPYGCGGIIIIIIITITMFVKIYKCDDFLLSFVIA